jgi:pyrroline-5-carboxylate reductase
MTVESNVVPSRLVFIGAGNMAEALLGGLLRAGLCPPERVVVTDVLPERLALFRSRFGVEVSAVNAEAVQGADVVVLAVKPQGMDALLAELRDALPDDALVISIAAGITTRRIESALGAGRRVVRVMPNTPCLIGCGASAIAPGSAAGEADLALATRLLEASGVVVPVAEKKMDAVTAVSGSGPAYFFYFIEAILTVAEEIDLDQETARTLAVATMEGAARLLRETGLPPEELRRRVTSKGGTTEAALKVLEERTVSASLQDAVIAATRRSQALSGE